MSWPALIPVILIVVKDILVVKINDFFIGENILQFSTQLSETFMLSFVGFLLLLIINYIQNNDYLRKSWKESVSLILIWRSFFEVSSVLPEQKLN